MVTLYDAKFGADPERTPRSDGVRSDRAGSPADYLVMELVDGGRRGRTESGRPARRPSTRPGVGAAAAGSAAVHQFGMVHRTSVGPTFCCRPRVR